MTATPVEQPVARIRVRSFATLRDALGSEEIILAVEDGATIHDVLLALEQTYGQSVVAQLRDTRTGQFVPFLVMLNDHAIPIYRRQSEHVKDGDRITILPPIDGG